MELKSILVCFHPIPSVCGSVALRFYFVSISPTFVRCKVGWGWYLHRVIRLRRTQVPPIKTCLINVRFHFLLHPLWARGWHWETLMWPYVSAFWFCIRTQRLLPQNTSSLEFVFPSPPPPHLSTTACVSHGAELPFSGDRTAAWCSTRTGPKFKLLLAEGRAGTFWWCSCQSGVNGKRRNPLWSLLLVTIDLAHSYAPFQPHYRHLQGEALLQKTTKLSIHCLNSLARHCLRHCDQYEDKGWLMHRNLGSRQH